MMCTSHFEYPGYDSLYRFYRNNDILAEGILSERFPHQDSRQPHKKQKAPTSKTQQPKPETQQLL